MIIIRFNGWRQWFNKKEENDQYAKLDENNEKDAEEKPVGMFQLVSIYKKQYSTMDPLNFILVSIRNLVRCGSNGDCCNIGMFTSSHQSWSCRSNWSNNRIIRNYDIYRAVLQSISKFISPNRK